MAAPAISGSARTGRLGYAVAIALSLAAHVSLLTAALVLAPRYLKPPRVTVPAYTVKIVDASAAGDLGTHLPPLAPPPPPRRAAHRPAAPEPAPRLQPPKAPVEILPPEPDREAVVLNTLGRRPLTPTPPPTPTPAPTPPPTPAPTARPSPPPVPTLRPTPGARPSPLRRPARAISPPPSAKRRPRSKPATPAPLRTPSVAERFARLREQLLAEHLAATAKPRKEAAAQGTGPLEARALQPGAGMGVGPGTGSAGIQKDAEFLLYYRTVQAKIKNAWTFSGGRSDLETQVRFAIEADGALTGVKITRGSGDPAFDDSVIRAIRRAAPFAPPPEKQRTAFAQGVEAIFRLGELKSGA